MPISSDPNRTVDYSIECDLKLPAEVRPAFVCRYMSMGDHARIAELLKQATALNLDDDGDQKWTQILRQIIGIGVVGWRNFDGPFSVDAVLDKLTPMECWELASTYRYAVRMGELDSKKSASPSMPAPLEGSAAVIPNDAK